jgi:hypothetical protein
MYWPVDKICVGPHEISQAWGLPLISMTVIINAIKQIYNLHFLLFSIQQIMTEHTEKQSSTKDTSIHGDTNLPDLTTDSPDFAVNKIIDVD